MPPYLISVDWGTSRLRLRLVDAAGDVLASVATDEGVASLASPDDTPSIRAGRFAELAQARVSALKAEYAKDGGADDAPVVISGMAGSSLGWFELPYARVPFPLDGSALVTRDLGPLGGGHHGHVILVSGVRSDDDVLRGEEVEMIGLAEAMGLPPRESLTLVLPGTHSKHLFIRDGVMTSFRTFLTGELFDLLCRHSVLRHSTAPIISTGDERDRGAFEAGVCRGAADDAALTAALFRVRTRQVLDGESKDSNTEFLSGLLIGNELASLGDAASQSPPVLVATQPPLASRYRSAAAILGLKLLDGPDPSMVDRSAALAHRRIVRSMPSVGM